MMPFTVKDKEGFRYTVLDAFTGEHESRYYNLTCLQDVGDGHVY